MAAKLAPLRRQQQHLDMDHFRRLSAFLHRRHSMKHDRRTFLVQTVCAACRRVDIQLLSAGVPAAAAPPGAPATPLLHTNGAPATAPTTSPAASRSVNAVTCGFASLNLVPIAGHERPDGP